MSPSCQPISGYSADEFYADPQLLTRIIHPDDQPLYAGHTHHMSALGLPEPIDFRIRTKDGETRWISHVCRPVHDSAGQSLGHRAGNRDVTHRKRVEAELAQQSLMAARAHADLQRFAEVTAHHLQEPARRMASYAERLTRQLGGRLDAAEARLSLDFIGQEARRQKNLLRDVERYLAADQPRDKIEEVDASDLVAGILVRLSTHITAAGATVTVGTLPPAWIDAPRLADLFEVALDNALQYGGQKSRRWRDGEGSAEHGDTTSASADAALRVTIDGEQEGSLVRYRVSDNGPGIEEEYRERVFRVFERLSSGGEEAGTGIGLAIVRRITESRGGRAWIEETPGGGCSVVFELPTDVAS
jgi:PAS domain S-box-containing protein